MFAIECAKMYPGHMHILHMYIVKYYTTESVVQ